MKKKLIIASLLLVILQALMAEEWYVCLGSFTIKENAEDYYTLLEKNNLSSWIYYTSTPKGNYYRVLYEVPKDSIEQARKLRNEVSASKAAKTLQLEGLWVCSAQKPVTSDKSEAKVVKSTEPDVKTTKSTEPEVKKAETKNTETKKKETKKADTKTVDVTEPEEEFPELEDEIPEPEIPAVNIINDNAK